MPDSKVIFKYQDQALCTYTNELSLDYLANDLLEASGDGVVAFSYLIQTASGLLYTPVDTFIPLSGTKILIEVLYKLSHYPVIKEENLVLLGLDDMITVERWIKVELNK